MQANPIILYVDDDPDDQYLFGSAVKKVAPQLNLVEVYNGMEALEFLQRAKVNANLPCLVVLDINMPFLDGRQTLQKIQTDTDLRHVPVVIFTSSKNPKDEDYFNSRGVELVVKPSDYKQYEPTINRFVQTCLPQN